jgi:quercetin dioxygenase-like cupin family protein
MRTPTQPSTLLLSAGTLLLAACGSTAVPVTYIPQRYVDVLEPAGTVALPAWTPEELAKPVAARRRHGDEHHTTFFIHLSTGEKPHTHDDHDLAVVLVAGSATMHLGERTLPMASGDVVEIPRGTVHWAENATTDPAGCVAYAIFTPSYDGTDTHPAAPR